MTTSFTTVSLPRDLGVLIRRIAKAENKAVVELVSGWAKDAAAKLGWDLDFSPIQGTVEWDGGEFIIRATFFGEGHRDFTTTQARSLADSITTLAERGGPSQTVDAAQVNLDAAGRFGFVVVVRKGSGIILALNDYRCSMSIEVAEGVARKLRELAQAAHARAAAGQVSSHARPNAPAKRIQDASLQGASPNSSLRPRRRPKAAKRP